MAKHILVRSDGYSITTVLDTNDLSAAQKAMTDDFHRLKPSELDETWEQMSSCGTNEAVLYQNGEEVFVWRILESAIEIPEDLYPDDLFWGLMSQDAIAPSKRDEDAGYDIYASDREHDILIMPHCTVNIPTGLCSAFHHSRVGILKERGSTGSRGIGQRCGVVDSGYRGEWFVPVTNHNDKPLLMTACPDKHLDEDCIVYDLNKAICQAVFLPLPRMRSQVASAYQVQKVPSQRGTGKLGSTN